MEVFDLGIDNLETVNLSLSAEDDPTPKPSFSSASNFGPGIELLMNDKKKSSSSSTMNIDVGELDRLESELNDMASSSSSSSSSTKTIHANVGGGGGESKMFSGFGSMFSGMGFGGSAAKEVDTGSDVGTDSNVGHATIESLGNTKTWDGFSKMSDIPVDKTGATVTHKMTEREKRRKKRAMIKKLEEWYEKGLVKHNSNFNMDSNYEEVEDEYETALEDKRKKDSVKLQGWWFMTFINSLEYANTVFNPFDLNLDGWGEQVSEDIDSYEEIFSELHDKYKGGKLSPELSLLLRLGFSAAVVNITNKALSTATPGFNDVIRQSPELMKMFTNATVSSMSQQSPGFEFANTMLNQERPGGGGGRGGAPSAPIPGGYGGPPPPPIETKTQPPPQRPGSMQFTPAASTRPDIAMGRGAMFREQGVEIGGGYEPISKQPSSRPEMRGPQTTDLDNILAGLKPKAPPTNVNIHMETETGNDDSKVSIASLKDMQNERIPKPSGGSRRKPRSEKNVVSLDI
jgi:hypothetical protein